MADEGFKRKLTAILSADAVGYSRLMAEDETATVKTIASYRAIMATLIKQHRGRVVDSPGDNLLAEFSSVVDAVQCAVAVQNEFQTRNAELAENRRMEFRIGINLGDVIDEEDRIYGDGVNVAARLEAMADPGGVCVSKTAFDQIETKLPLGYEYLGEQPVKNIPKPVGAYRVLMKPDAVGKVIGEKRFLGKISRRTAMAAIIVLILVAGGLISWNIYLHQSKRIEPASIEKMAFPLPEKPSIAVLPFVNMSEDPKQEYFSDGLTVDIITALSKIPDLFVIARNSAFTYKEKPVNVKQVAEEMGIRYVLEGSVRRAEERVRITAQLIDALKGDYLWAERYDRALEGIFGLQDEITMNILTALQVKLTEGEKMRVFARSTDNLMAYQKWQKGRMHLLRLNSDDIAVAKKLFEESIASDPNYSSAYVDLAWAHLFSIHLGMSRSPKESLGQAAQLAQEAISLDDTSSHAHGLLGVIFAVKKQFEEAIAQGEKAVALSPNDSLAKAVLGRTLGYAGRYEEALSWLEKAIRLDPIPLDWYFTMVGHCYLYMGRLEEALEELKKNRNQDDITNRLRLAAVYSLLGREEDARAEAAEVLRLNPKFSLKSIARWPYKNRADIDFMMTVLSNAGLPE
ncbi:MAG: adenylate/guanylate cyclase domain-containing protein [Desulfobacterales bacterium]|nr:adenylate/guanylate cyclase domain-containing protein [Desulfobacterales bacterium]